MRDKVPFSAFAGRPLGSVRASMQPTYHLAGVAATGAASAGLPDTSATEVALKDEGLRRFNFDAQRAELLQPGGKWKLPSWKRCQAVVSLNCLHLNSTAVESAHGSRFDA